MYHCRCCFYLVGGGVLEEIRSMPPQEHFSHEFLASDEPEQALAARADVILADLSGLDVPVAVELLLQSRREEAELILLADREQTPLLPEDLSGIRDVWLTPMTGRELRFRFLRWQQGYRTRKELWETSQYLETTINSVPNMVWYKTKDGIHEKVNNSFCKTVNKTREQVQGRGHAYIWDVEQDDPACIESEREVMRLQRTCVSEEKVLTGEGTRLLTTYKSPLYDVDGSVMGTVGVAIDVTQERTYEREIVKKNRTLEMIFTTMDCGIMCHSLDGEQILSINRAALQILDYDSREELQKAGFHMVAASVVEEDRAKLEECIRSLKKAGDNAGVEYRVCHRDGSIVHVMGNVKLVRENGELFYQRFLLDCTARKLREERERTEHERRQMELVHALSMDYSLACIFDLDTGVGNALRISDHTDQALTSVFSGTIALRTSMGLYIEQFVCEEDREMMRQAAAQDRLKSELADKRQYYVNYRAVLNGEMKYYQMKAVRAGDWNERRCVVLGFRSVDEETRREMEKKSLLEGALMQANRANKAKSVFLSNMSHDIRTPMNAIVGFTALAMTHLDSREQVEEYLKKIMTSGNHLVSLINDILDMSRIESGKMYLDETLCSLPDILHGLRSMVQADIHAKRLELYIDAVDVTDEEIYCDRLRLNQVLLNLLSNSIKYTGAGGTVSMRITEKPGAPSGYANYEFCIKDTGIGMSAEFVSHIFEPFERERTSTISGIQGTGLGMSITKNIVDMMNGTITVESEQGAGTEFTVGLTFRLSGEPKEAGAIPELKGCRALVVDDDFNTCDSVTDMLQKMGLRAEWTLSGKEAVLRTRQAVARRDDYCVYIIDWLMPDMNGIEVTRRIRKETGEDVPVIVLTAYDWSDIEEEARQAGVTAFCSKPLFQSELRRCLCSVVEAEEQRGLKEEEKKQRARPRSGRILLAEDNELNREIAAALLGEVGFETEAAGNGQIAVDMLCSHEPGYYRLVLMDIQMPVLDGYEATRAIRRLENRALAEIPILAMTANAFGEDRRAALECGMNGHIAKPINMDDLLEMMDEVLESAPAAGAGQSGKEPASSPV